MMPRIVESCENEVLGILHLIFCRLGWNVLAKVFDGLIVESASTADEGDLNSAMRTEARQRRSAARVAGWSSV